MILSDHEIDEVDKLYYSPQERAQGVYSILTQHLETLVKEKKITDVPTPWDILCFAVEYVGMQAISIQDPKLLGISLALHEWLRGAHYSEPEKIYGKPDKVDKTLEGV